MITVLLAIICFLLYLIYKVKYGGTQERGNPASTASKDLREALESLGADDRGEIERRIRELESKISEMDERIGKNEDVVERLADELT